MSWNNAILKLGAIPKYESEEKKKEGEAEVIHMDDRNPDLEAEMLSLVNGKKVNS